jgi:hypothetical protein
VTYPTAVVVLQQFQSGPLAPHREHSRASAVVVADGGNGKVLFSSGSKPTAEAVAKRYPDSKVREKGNAPAAGTKQHAR